jgi:hypothetical protein
MCTLPAEIWEIILNFVPIPRVVYDKHETDAFSLRLVNKTFAEKLKYQLNVCQMKDTSRFIEATLKHIRLVMTDSNDKTIEFCWCVNAGITICAKLYELDPSCYLDVSMRKHVLRPGLCIPKGGKACYTRIGLEKEVYRQLIHQLPTELSFVHPLKRELFLKYIWYAFHPLDYFLRYFAGQRQPMLKSSLQKMLSDR